MKKIIIFVFLLSLVSILSGCVNIFTVDYYEDSDKYLIGSQEYEGTLDTLDIDWVFGYVKLIEDESATKITIKEENELPDTIKVHSYFENGKLYIKFGEAGYKGSGIKSKEKSLEITYNNLKNINIKLTSGELSANSITTNEAKIILTSGTIKVNSVSASNTNIKLTSGKIMFDSFTSTTSKIKMTSGSISVDSAYCDTIDCELTSGSCSFNLKSCKNAEFRETSGSINLTIPEDTATKVTLNKTSGSIRTDRTFTRVGNDYTFGPLGAEVISTITINVTSGNVRIK